MAIPTVILAHLMTEQDASAIKFAMVRSYILQKPRTNEKMDMDW